MNIGIGGPRQTGGFSRKGGREEGEELEEEGEKSVVLMVFG